MLVYMVTWIPSIYPFMLAYIPYIPYMDPMTNVISQFHERYLYRLCTAGSTSVFPAIPGAKIREAVMYAVDCCFRGAMKGHIYG